MLGYVNSNPDFLNTVITEGERIMGKGQSSQWRYSSSLGPHWLSSLTSVWWYIMIIHHKAKILPESSTWRLSVAFIFFALQIARSVGNRNLVAPSWQRSHQFFASGSNICDHTQHYSCSSVTLPFSHISLWFLTVFKPKMSLKRIRFESWEDIT